jgi:hypothetical protein
VKSLIITFIGAIFLSTPLLAQKSYMDPSTYISYKDSRSGILFSMDKTQMEPHLYKADEIKTTPVEVKKASEDDAKTNQVMNKITENEYNPGPKLLELYKSYVSIREEWNIIKDDKNINKDKKAKKRKAVETAGDWYFNMLYEYSERTDIHPVVQILSLAQLQILNENYYYGAMTNESKTDLAEAVKTYTNYKTDFFPERIKQYCKKMPSDTADEIMTAVDAAIEKKMEGKRPAATSELNKKDKK